MKIILIAQTKINPLAISDYLEKRGEYWPGTSKDEVFCLPLGHKSDNSVLAEFAGRICYDAFSDRGRPDNARYLKNIIEHGHGSVLEHCNYTYLITGVSRAMTHELVRHRAGFAFSQLSTRFADPQAANLELVVPALVKHLSEDKRRLLYEYMESIEEQNLRHYNKIKDLITEEVEAKYENKRDARKAARQTARYALTHMTETRIVVTGNARAWRHFINMRGNIHADTEIREIAVHIAKELQSIDPNIFYDLEVFKDSDEIESVKMQHGKV